MKNSYATLIEALQFMENKINSKSQLFGLRFYGECIAILFSFKSINTLGLIYIENEKYKIFLMTKEAMLKVTQPIS